MVSEIIHLKDISEFIEDSLKTSIVCGWGLVTLVKMSFTALLGGSPTKSMIIFTWVLFYLSSASAGEGEGNFEEELKPLQHSYF